MSKQLINQYYTNLDRVLQFGKSTNEQSIRTPFLNLLNEYAHKQNYEVIAEISCMGTKGSKVRPDGIVKNLFGLDIGLWESKDEKTDLEEEIDEKIKKGYPLTNILFEDSKTAVLYQRGEEVNRVSVRDADKLHKLLTEFFSFKSDTVYKFEDALEKFKADIPTIVETLRSKIEAERKKNKNYIEVSESFLELCKAEINPEITFDDVREMMIQHILTSDIFNKIFDDAAFHQHNNIANELEKLVGSLFTHTDKQNLLGSIEHYYDAMNAAASGITDHHEKQKFLKVLYENFYKVYNPKAADRLGVVYTPNEIVNFMIESTDYLLYKHFNKTLADKNVEILDPATGTGTFITSIIDYIPNQHLAYKYLNEIYANEVAILPYYVANLNIEFAYKQKMKSYAEFKNLCFVDTLDNIAALKGVRRDKARQTDMFGLTSENSARIKKQNEKKISVVIGNPPYNANQKNENENNKNREYPAIDKHIKQTFIEYSTAQKTKVYDMYARFYRWAMDRVDNNGVIAFVTNRSFIDSRSFDGFRKCVQDDFTACYIVDTKTDIRNTKEKIAGTTHNVFGIQTGVAIMFLVKKEKQEEKCKIEYVAMEDIWRKEEKLEWLRNHKLESIAFEKITPDKNNNWINLSENNWDALVSLEKLFTLKTPGTVSNRDDWTYDFSEKCIEKKFRYESTEINKLIEQKNNSYPATIKWSNTLKTKFLKGIKASFNREYIIKSQFRPFSLKYYFADKYWNDRLTQNHYDIFGNKFDKQNICFSFNGVGMDKTFHIIATKYLPHLQLTPNGHCVSL